MRQERTLEPPDSRRGSTQPCRNKLHPVGRKYYQVAALPGRVCGAAPSRGLFVYQWPATGELILGRKRNYVFYNHHHHHHSDHTTITIPTTTTSTATPPSHYHRILAPLPASHNLLRPWTKFFISLTQEILASVSLQVQLTNKESKRFPCLWYLRTGDPSRYVSR